MLVLNNSLEHYINMQFETHWLCVWVCVCIVEVDGQGNYHITLVQHSEK